MEILIPIIGIAGAISLFIVAYFTYRTPKAKQLKPIGGLSPSNTDNLFWNRFLNFDEFITTQILKGFYIVGSGIIIIGAVVSIGAHLRMLLIENSLSEYEILQRLFLTFVIGAFALLVWQLLCEIVIVTFKINENLQAIRDHKELKK